MKMTRVEKLFVNRDRKAKRNIVRIQDCFQQVEVQSIHNVLEIGCGIGAVSSFLSTNYTMNVTGIDLDEQQVELASTMQEVNEKLTFKQADATQLEFPNESFDMVIAQNVFHHIPDWETAINIIYTRVILKKYHMVF